MHNIGLALVLVLWAVAGYFTWQTAVFLGSAVKTIGTVESFQQWIPYPNKVHYTPVFSFTDTKGRKKDRTKQSRYQYA